MKLPAPITEEEKRAEERYQQICIMFEGTILPFDIVHRHTGELIIPMHRRVTKTLIKRMIKFKRDLDISMP